MKIAIIGGGISGLCAAYIASPEHDITLYERNNRLGGHAHTISVSQNEGPPLMVDNGFMVFNPDQYPNFLALLERLQVATVPTTMSFSVDIANTVAFKSTFPGGTFAKLSNSINPRYLRFIAEIVRFQRVAKRELKNGPTEGTVGQFLSAHKFSPQLGEWFLYPMLSAIWSVQSAATIESFPLTATLEFMRNHKLLDIRQPQWRTISGGSIEYVKQIEAFIKQHGGNIRLDAPVKEVVRTKTHVTVRTSDSTQSYDYVLMATHADVSKKLIGDLSKQEEVALGAFSYSRNSTVLHSDTSVLPDNRRLVAAWNYRTSHVGKPATFTYNMNLLQHISERPMLITLNSDQPINPSLTHHHEEYAHPQYNLASVNAQRQLSSLQATRRTLFAGAHMGYGFHEDGVNSAMNALQSIGITAPWLTDQ